MDKLGQDEVVLLLGAGASVEAGVPESRMMIQQVEAEIDNGDWGTFRDLYHFTKASILYSTGIQGDFSDSGFHIEFACQRL